MSMSVSMIVLGLYSTVHKLYVTFATLYTHPDAVQLHINMNTYKYKFWGANIRAGKKHLEGDPDQMFWTDHLACMHNYRLWLW